MIEELIYEEDRELLKRITRLTEQGKIKWNLVEYGPLCFMNEDIVDETSAYLCQMFTLTTKFNGLPYELELSEYITIPDGKGNIALTLIRDIEDGFLKIDTALSRDFEIYENCTAEKIAFAYAEDPIMKITAFLVPNIIDSDIVMEAVEWAAFIYEKGISEELLNDPLVRLAEKLFNEWRPLDYHKILFDIPYRKSLMMAAGICTGGRYSM
ncbi:MAG TPA: hypothetical protein IAB44_00060 [Candidatus Limivivens intestinipullorum]|uniref:Uncharacterized protein n=1 Tax=Candidatus Limivivens intestinipullorum TaxID=2840858 RepID=A0A9D1EPK6_9FIRM|nr:hypothetical protein [Candidatus Limivivens intestinipullorum]